jgi:3-(3-hydroxy-phenyl)propionate hydroxylase
MEEKDPVARTKNFEQLAATAADPLAHRAYLLRASLLDSVKKRTVSD